MSDNYDGLYELRIFYTVTISSVALPHRMTFDLRIPGDEFPGTPFSAITVVSNDISFYDLESWLLDATYGFMPKLRACYNSAAEFGRAELWKIPEGTTDATFIGSLELGLTGTSAIAAQVAQQATFTFRTGFGGIMRLQLMEPAIAGNGLDLPPYSNTDANALSLYVIGPNSCILGRDNSVPFARIKLGLGQNEKTFRQRFRSGT